MSVPTGMNLAKRNAICVEEPKIPSDWVDLDLMNKIVYMKVYEFSVFKI